MRLAWGVIAVSAAIGLAIIACSSFSADDETPGDLDGAIDATTDGRATGDGPLDGGPDACVGLDLATDPKNCGVCSHHCLGGDCLDGGCLPKRVATSPNNIRSLAVTDGGVHWVTNSTTVYTCALDGCTDAGTLATIPLPGTSIVSFGDGVAVAATDNLMIITASGAATRVAGNYNTVISIASDDARYVHFVAVQNNIKLFRFDAAGDAGAEVSYDNGALRSVGAAGTHVFYDMDVGGEVLGICDAPTCPNPHSLLTALSSTPAMLAPTKNALFWARSMDAKVDTCPIAGCASPTTLVQPAELASLATDDDFIYFSTGNTGGAIERCPQAGCGGANRVVLAKGADPHALVVSGKALYWATDNTPTNPPAIWRLAR